MAQNLDDLLGKLSAYEYVKCTVFDLAGSARGKVIPVRHAKNVMKNGMPIYSGKCRCNYSVTTLLRNFLKRKKNKQIYNQTKRGKVKQTQFNSIKTKHKKDKHKNVMRFIKQIKHTKFKNK